MHGALSGKADSRHSRLPSHRGGRADRSPRAQAAPFRPVYHLGEQVQALEPLSGGAWQVTTSKGTVVRAKAVIIAAGVRRVWPESAAFARHRDHEGKSVFYYVTQRDNFRGKRIVITGGGGDTAVDWALSLAEIAAHVR